MKQIKFFVVPFFCVFNVHTIENAIPVKDSKRKKIRHKKNNNTKLVLVAIIVKKLSNKTWTINVITMA